MDSSVVVDTTTKEEEAGRALYRLLFVSLVLVVGILTDSRRLVDAASLLI